MTSSARNAPDSPIPAPASMGWLSAHAMEAGRSLSAWWLAPLAGARVDAALMSVTAAGGQAVQETLLEFVKPFRAAEEHADLIRDPVRASGLSAIAAAGLGGLFDKPGQAAVKPGTSSGQRPTGGSRVETGNSGNSTVRGANVSPGRRFPGISNPAAGKPATSTDRPLPRPGSRDGVPARANAKPLPPAAQTPFEDWADKVTRKLSRYVSTSGNPSGTGENPPAGSGNPAGGKVPFRRAPFIPPEDPETLMRFKALMESQLAHKPGSPAPLANDSANGSANGVADAPADVSAGSVPAASGSAGNGFSSGGGGTGGGNTVTSTLPKFPEPFRKPGAGGHDLSDLVRDLYPLIGKTPSPPAVAGSGRDPEVDNGHSPLQAPFPALPAFPPAASPSRVPAAEAPATSAGNPLPGRAAETEWLQEEDDLAARLHRLLRRQAKRRGVDLA